MRSDMSPGRTIVILLIVGTALGVLYNAAGLMSRPQRGIPWLAAKGSIADLDTLAAPPPGAGIAAAQEPAVLPAPAAAAQPPASDPTPTEPKHATHKPDGAGGAARAGEASATPRTTTPPPTAARRAAPPEAPPATTTQPPSSATTPEKPPASAPFIPESDHPVRVKLSTAKIFFDTGAALFLDARDASEFEAGHIPGAMRLTREDALSEPDRVKELPVRGRPIVAYCDGGECEASLELAQALVGAGYRKVLVYAGGFPEWVAAGYPVERAGAAK